MLHLTGRKLKNLLVMKKQITKLMEGIEIIQIKKYGLYWNFQINV